MALRTVVLEGPSSGAPPATPAPSSPPTGPRRTVVLRPGPPPKAKGAWLDLLMGIVGAILLILAIVLVVALPDKEYPRPQFQLRVLEPPGEFPTRSHTFDDTDAGNDFDFVYEIPVDNVYSFTAKIRYIDDQPASLPDKFRVELLNPAGEPVGTPVEFQNPDPTPPASGSLTYTAKPEVALVSIPIGPKPPEQILQGIDRDETADEVLDRIAPTHFLPTVGNWTLRVVLTESGDCPDGNPSAGDVAAIQRNAACRADANDGIDPGNLFAVELFSYSSFALDVLPLES